MVTNEVTLLVRKYANAQGNEIAQNVMRQKKYQKRSAKFPLEAKIISFISHHLRLILCNLIALCVCVLSHF